MLIINYSARKQFRCVSYSINVSPIIEFEMVNQKEQVGIKIIQRLSLQTLEIGSWGQIHTVRATEAHAFS